MKNTGRHSVLCIRMDLVRIRILHFRPIRIRILPFKVDQLKNWQILSAHILTAARLFRKCVRIKDKLDFLKRSDPDLVLLLRI
jgi:hypothetical protein